MKKKKLDIVSIGGSTVDIFIRPEHQTTVKVGDEINETNLICFTYGGKQKIKEIHETFGGGATNTAIGFKRLGLYSGACIGIGRDEWGQKIRSNLEKEGVETGFVHKTRSKQSGFSIIINSPEGERTVLFYPGANQHMSKTFMDAELINSTRWLFINRISGDAEAIIKKVIAFKKKRPSLKIAWNPGGQQIKDGMNQYRSLLKHLDVLFLNKEESIEFTRPRGKKHNSIADERNLDIPKKRGAYCVPEYVHEYTSIFKRLKKAGVKTTVITNGQCGAHAFHKGEVTFCPVVPHHKRIDTLGAGDAFATGCTYALVQGLSLQNALKFGTINSTSVIKFYGAQAGLLTKRQLQEAYEKHKLKTVKNKIPLK